MSKIGVDNIRTALNYIGVPDEILALGGNAQHCWCIEQSAEDGLWEVYWSERGLKQDLARLDTEEKACIHLLGRLTYSQLIGLA